MLVQVNSPRYQVLIDHAVRVNQLLNDITALDPELIREEELEKARSIQESSTTSLEAVLTRRRTEVMKGITAAT